MPTGPIAIEGVFMSAVLPVTASLQVGGIALTAIAKAIHGLYGMAVEINVYLDRHIEEMRGSENPTISRSGRILEMAKVGFGIGYVAPVVIIATGQLLLGNTFAAVATVATAATLTNPVAMTCAAIGAIYYGWGALTDVEREEMLDKLSKGLEIGVEFVKAVVHFVVDKTKELLSAKNLDEMKRFIASTADAFGKSLSSVTHQVSDVLSDGFDVAREFTGKVIDKSGDVIGDVYDATAETAQKTAEGARKVIKKVRRSGDAAKIDGGDEVGAPTPALLRARPPKGKN